MRAGGRRPQEIGALAKRLLREEWEAPRERAAPEAARGEPERSEARNAASHREVRAPSPSLPTLDLERPGAYLRRCRRALGLTLREMTECTRIQGLADIEAERFEALPPEPYLRGFLLAYARELGIPELEALTGSYLDRYRRFEGE